jgi:hypothetical protein
LTTLTITKIASARLVLAHDYPILPTTVRDHENGKTAVNGNALAHDEKATDIGPVYIAQDISA